MSEVNRNDPLELALLERWAVSRLSELGPEARRADVTARRIPSLHLYVTEVAERGSSVTQGVCKLTGKNGKFIDAHIIPKALTRPDKPGLPFTQTGPGKKPERRWSSWYDGMLVIREGEDVLTALDTWAIPELRRLRLVWSGWGPQQSLGNLHTPIPGTPWGLRKVVPTDPFKFRLFFLSLLWRAAASERPEFNDIVMPPEDLENLRLMLLGQKAIPVDFYPASLIQLSTRGPEHNHSPIAMDKAVPDTSGGPSKSIPIFRFYFEGLICHFHRQASDDGEAASLGNFMIGAGDEILLNTQTYEDSFQLTNMLEILNEAEANWPDVMAKLDVPVKGTGK